MKLLPRKCAHQYPCDHGIQAYKQDNCRCIVCQQAVAIRYAPATTFIEGTGTARRIQALVAIGYPLTDLRAQLGMWLDSALTGTNPYVTAGLARAVLALYDQLWKAPQTGTAAAENARSYAQSKGWVGPLNWDDDNIDDPAAKPAGIPKDTDDQETTKPLPFEELEELLQNNRPMDEIIRASGTTAAAIFRRLHRANRKDLIAYIPEPRRYYAKGATPPGLRIPA